MFNSGHIWLIELPECVERLNVVHKTKTRVKKDVKMFGLENQKNAVALN